MSASSGHPVAVHPREPGPGNKGFRDAPLAGYSTKRPINNPATITKVPLQLQIYWTCFVLRLYDERRASLNRWGRTHPKINLREQRCLLWGGKVPEQNKYFQLGRVVLSKFFHQRDCMCIKEIVYVSRRLYVYQRDCICIEYIVYVSKILNIYQRDCIYIKDILYVSKRLNMYRKNYLFIKEIVHISKILYMYQRDCVRIKILTS